MMRAAEFHLGENGVSRAVQVPQCKEQHILRGAQLILAQK